ncbi:MAG: HD domain-containing protein [Desulfovibrionaceae bacterium]|nr:HD domain-containing protein [Desulfovibrionaceae bacterium]
MRKFPGKEIQSFTAYTRGFRSGDPVRDKHLNLKYAHSLRVLRNARIIAKQEEAFRRYPQAKRALNLAALYHDLGRFEQLKRFGTFRDADSVNHGLLGAKLLAKQGFLADETPELRRLTRCAVLWHNRLALPDGLPEEFALVSRAIRDADKIDIIGVLNREFQPGRQPDKTIVLELRNETGAYSPKALEAVLAGRTVLYDDMRVINDFRLLLCSWVFGLEFTASRRLLAQSGLLEETLAGLPAGADLDKARARVRGRLNE